MLLNCRLARGGAGVGVGVGAAAGAGAATGGGEGNASGFITPVATCAASLLGGVGVTIVLAVPSFTTTGRGGGSGGGTMTIGSLGRGRGACEAPGIPPAGRVAGTGGRCGCGDVRDATNSLIDAIVCSPHADALLRRSG